MNFIHWIRDRFAGDGPVRPDSRLKISNLTRQTVLAGCVEVADRGAARSKGLLGRDCLPSEEGLWIVPCEGVHTFGMKFPIDLVYLDRDKRVKKVRHGVPPWRLSTCLSAHSVLELAAGSIRKAQTQPGDALEFSSALPSTDCSSSPDVSGPTPLKPESTTRRRGAAINGISMRDLYEYRFHVRMACACAVILGISIAGCRLMSVDVDWGSLMIALLVAVAAVLPLPLYWHEKQRTDMRDAAMTIPWAFVLAVILPLSVDVAARMDMPLQDANFARLDESLGVSVPGIVAWAAHHWFGILANKSYPLLIPLLPIAILAPALTGKWKDAQDFLVANMAAFVIGLSAFALLPAVGPWYGYHLAAPLYQLQSQSELFLLRTPGPYISHPAGIVCFPSFHVIWAILCARGLWGFRFLRIPITMFSGVIILSTLTTGWHYFIDVLAGAIVAIFSIALAARCNRSSDIEWLPPTKSAPTPPPIMVSG